MNFALRAAILSLVLAARAWALDSFVVRDIRVEGIQRIEAGTVFNYLPIKVGDTVTDEKAAGAIRALFATGFFRDVRLEAQGDLLIVTVEERPAIASIEFTGMKEFEKDKVKQGLRDVGFQEGRIFDRALLEQAEQELKRQYLTRALYGVQLTTTVTPLERNRVAINFNINEGEVAKIKRINIVGNQAFPEDELLGAIQLRTPGFFTWLTKNDQYSRQKLQADLESLRSYYLNRGYLEFNIDSTQVSITPDKLDIFITINVTEGEKYEVGDIKLGGDLLVPEEELRSLITIKSGETFSRERLTESSKAISDRLGRDGYAFANVNANPDVDKQKRKVSFTFLVDPGKRVYVRRINIVGNTRTRDEVVRREMRQLEGSFFDSQKLQLSKQRVDKTGFFRGGCRDSGRSRNNRPGRCNRAGQGEADRPDSFRSGVLQHRQVDSPSLGAAEQFPRHGQYRGPADGSRNGKQVLVVFLHRPLLHRGRCQPWFRLLPARFQREQPGPG